MIRRTTLLAAMALAGCGWLTGGPLSARGAVLISDDFSRPQNPTYLGWTDQGYLWRLKTFNAPTPIDISMYHPGIKNEAMYWGATGNAIGSIAYMTEPGPIKDFRMEFDLTYGGTVQNGYGFYVNFRSGSPASMVSDGGITPGYALFLNPVNPATTKQLTASLYSDYPSSNGLITTGSSVAVSDYSGVHVAIEAQDNRIQVWFDGTKALDYTDDTSSNPARDQAGYFSFNANVWKEFTLDNFIVSTLSASALTSVPEPASMTLLALVGAGILTGRRRR